MTRDEIIKLLDEAIAKYNRHKGEFGVEPIGVWLAMSTVDDIRDLLKAEPKRGRWIRLDMYAGMEQFKCYACGAACYVPTCMGEPMYGYCPNCGAKMEVDA